MTTGTIPTGCGQASPAGPPRLISLSLSAFLTHEQCPPDWQGYDLYLVGDEEVVFYVGQSRCAFDRVWEHIRDGFKGRSVVGRFILLNWPRSLRFALQLLSSQDPQFAGVDFDRNRAEWLLIDQHAPCLNAALNREPAPLPPGYLPPDASGRRPRNLRHMILAAQEMQRRRAPASHWRRPR